MIPALAAARSRSTALLVEEALSAVLAPERMSEVIEDALLIADLPDIPQRPAPFRRFIEGPLRAAVAGHLAMSDAVELIAQLQAAAEVVGQPAHTSDVRRRAVADPPVRVLVVTRASLVVSLLRDMLGDHVEVVALQSAVRLRARILGDYGQPLLVIVDRKHPCVGKAVLTFLRDQLTERSTLVWWGADVDEGDEVRDDLRNDPAAGAALLVCGPEVGLADLGDVCRALFGA